MKTILKAFCVLAATALFGLSANALDLDQARSKKLVVEQPDGYIKAVDPSAKALADDVNAKRKQAYEEVAKKENVDVKMVGEKAAQKIKEKLGN